MKITSVGDLHHLFYKMEEASGDAQDLNDSFKENYKVLDPLDSKSHYMMGITHYLYCGDKPDVDSAKTYFELALEVDSLNYMARLYLAHCLHDQNFYRDALENYLKVDREKLRSEMPIWRLVKMLEQVGYCLFMIDRTEEALVYFEMSLDIYKQGSADEMVDPDLVYEVLGKENSIYTAFKYTEELHYL